MDKNTGNIYDDIEVIQDIPDDFEKVLTIKFEVNKDLEAKWYVISDRHEPVQMSPRDRGSLNVYKISDYIDRHFYWSKGSPLYSLLLDDEGAEDVVKENIIVDVVRQVKQKIDECPFESFQNVTAKIKTQVSNYGIKIDDVKTSIDFKDISIKEGQVCLHDKNIPFRLKGKGSKRLISIAIQAALAQKSGIILVDEIEQGLEPDRVKQLIRTIKAAGHGQMFVTTHSVEAITEIDCCELGVLKNDKGSVSVNYPDKELQGVVRACPQAFFSNKIIVCEGNTEVGLCRALDINRKANDKEYMAFLGCVYICGMGDNFPNYALKLKSLGFNTAILCDSDKDYLSHSKKELADNGIEIYDCDKEKSIENQLFCDLLWKAVAELIKYREETDGHTKNAIAQAVKSKYGAKFPDQWLEDDTLRMRTAISEASVVKGKEWFKRIDHGEFLGKKIFEYKAEMLEKRIVRMMDDLSKWIDE